MKYSTQHKYQCSEDYDKWALKNLKGMACRPITRQAYMAACRTCIEGCNPGNGSEWISVYDRLPADTGVPYKRYFVRHFNRLDPDLFWTGAQYWVDGKWDIENVTHWMPLPEPPIEPTTGTKTNEKKSTRYVMPDTEEHRLLAEKLADTEDGQIIPLTSLELSLLIDIETIGG